MLKRFMILLSLSPIFLGMSCELFNDNELPIKILHDYKGYIYYSNADSMYSIYLQTESIKEFTKANVKTVNITEPDETGSEIMIAIDGGGEGSIKVMNKFRLGEPGGEHTVIVNHNPDVMGYCSYFHAPRISYNEKYIAYDGYPFYQATYVVEVANGNLVRTIGDLNNSKASYYSPSWGPDGSIYVQGAPDRNGGIYKVDKDFQSITRIDPNLTNVLSPCVSPNGKCIAFIHDDELWTMNPDGSNAAKITTNLPGLRSPVWSPDSYHIAVVSNSKIFVIDPRTNTSTAILKGFTEKDQICWSLY